MPLSVPVDLGSRSYAIHIGEGLLESLGSRCLGLKLGRSCLLVSDSHVDPLYGAVAEASLEAAGFSVARCAVPAGEASKSGAQLFALYDAALAAGLDRHAFIVALGGGVVGDLAGYAAASYLRGIPYVQVPTSLLAMVDSSVGGKTGINLPQGKNLIGSFHQPVLVLADSEVLATLPQREFAAGMAEIIKYGVIRDEALFTLLEASAAELGPDAPGLLEPVIARCCEIKAEVVKADEEERAGVRALLNFGHTLGHAIENVAGYGEFLHGEAISIGMVFAARLSVRLRGLPEGDAGRLEHLLGAFGLPVHAPDLEWPALRDAMSRDKKAESRLPKFVLAERIGHAVSGCAIPESELEETWNGCR